MRTYKRVKIEGGCYYRCFGTTTRKQLTHSKY